MHKFFTIIYYIIYYIIFIILLLFLLLLLLSEDSVGALGDVGYVPELKSIEAYKS